MDGQDAGVVREPSSTREASAFAQGVTRLGFRSRPAPHLHKHVPQAAFPHHHPARRRVHRNHLEGGEDWGEEVGGKRVPSPAWPSLASAALRSEFNTGRCFVPPTPRRLPAVAHVLFHTLSRVAQWVALGCIVMGLSTLFL